jgi:hypothetical protein
MKNENLEINLAKEALLVTGMTAEEFCSVYHINYHAFVSWTRTKNGHKMSQTVRGLFELIIWYPGVIKDLRATIDSRTLNSSQQS